MKEDKLQHPALIEVKASLSAADDGAVEGLAWPFGTPDRVGDMIEKGAFSGSAVPIPMLFGHNPNDPVGVWEAVEETSEGLRVKGRLLVAEVGRAREVQAMVKSGAVRGLSIGFITKKASARRGGGRTITSLELAEISLVTIPMHPKAGLRGTKAGADAIALAEAINRAASALRSSRG
ncbi:MAG TPA: HK97 family phage prohead protease [Aurantimonas coralicida]|uniref:HK97 family phage prohead protease n=2 Tax=root TaxID=1 RepID=A0A9C9NJE7_9HYPH|nr:HK97 family phage prohead protease [Aurantimonas coralicida]HEU02618.1 HK97 family phage prohead protease [Aurantimonas coralicida]